MVCCPSRTSMPARLQLEDHRQLDHVHAQRHVAHASASRMDLISSAALRNK